MNIFTTQRLITTGDPVSPSFHYLLQRVFHLNFTAAGLYGWLLLPGGHSVSFNVDPEEGEVLAGKLGPLEFYRPETKQERRDREDAEGEAAFEAYWADRYL